MCPRSSSGNMARFSDLVFAFVAFILMSSVCVLRPSLHRHCAPLRHRPLLLRGLPIAFADRLAHDLEDLVDRRIRHRLAHDAGGQDWWPGIIEVGTEGERVGEDNLVAALDAGGALAHGALTHEAHRRPQSVAFAAVAASPTQ